MKRQRIGNTDDAIAVQGGHAGWAVDAIVNAGAKVADGSIDPDQGVG